MSLEWARCEVEVDFPGACEAGKPLQSACHVSMNGSFRRVRRRGGRGRCILAQSVW